MSQSGRGTMNQKQADESQKSLQTDQQRPESVRALDNGSVSLTSQRPGSFWGRLGRRISQKRSSSSALAGFSGAATSTAAIDNGSLRSRMRSMSGGDETHDIPPMPLLAVQGSAAAPPLMLTAASGANSGPAAQAGDVCKYCGHAKFLEFAVAADSASPDKDDADSGKHHMRRGSPTLLVCKKCKRVKGMPE
ncbi:hypothetical protein GGI23_006948 [Coemansia sp. RSA 2559]|nr:hypothetical protein GGI23_006948 [Coemansia sp. RSA 2559]